ncbi:MAG: choice-of-anchor Q domain-containing protein [Mangrovibacterium sp.]
MKKIFYISVALLMLIYMVSCEDERYLSSTNAKLAFSVDTVMFDTIFTTIGSTTQHLKVYNPYDQKILISTIRLAGGEGSNFRLNINGFPADELYDVEIPPKDSIYIFVEVTINPVGRDLPIVVKDSIEFLTNANLQDVDLLAWGQDIFFVKNQISKSTTWTAEKPYLVYSNTKVDSGAVLSIDPGAKIYFHRGTGLYVKGKILVNGTQQQPVIFQGDRLEDVYRDVPDQWNGILLYSGSQDNVFNYAEIKNANIGLQVGTIENSGFASVVLAGTKIYNHAYAGIFSLKSKIRCYNSVIANCGFYAAALLVGGEYEFYHTTIANYWGGFSGHSRSTPALMISDHVIAGQTTGAGETYLGDLKKAFFANSIITGNMVTGNELELIKTGEAEFNYRFDHCLLQVADTFKTTNANHYSTILKGLSPKFIDPYTKLNFELDTLSPAKDAGLESIGALFPADFLGQSRTSDNAPDLGAYERVEKKRK